MKESRIIEINGIFIGAAVSLRDRAGWQVVAADARVGPVDGRVAASYQDATAIARQAYWAAQTQKPHPKAA